MQITDFKYIVTTFADPGSELLFDNTSFGISINGDFITADITARSGDVYVNEGSGSEPASTWILRRLARLPLLATRLRETIPETEYFVSPVVSHQPTLECAKDDHPTPLVDGLEQMLHVLGNRSPLETLVLYITSDAGEGKTSLINELAREQARRFIDHRADWLLVPIPLGGRPFLRFDDITVGVMQNRYRFPFLYYQSFLALVQMGVIVPAFDGFEEMFVENSSGEALSAIGTLVRSLDSRGAIVLAARRAYFEFENLRTQERLFDTIKEYAVGFSKLELHRWEKQQFIEYCLNRHIDGPEELYQRVSERLSHSHALLTRAVLVKRLVDVAEKSATLDGFLDSLQKSGADFFSVFVRGLIEREANEKWLYRDIKDGVGTPLLTVDEHCELLSQIALSMWEGKVDFLKRDSLEFAAEYFCETAGKDAREAQQIRDRVRGHALLIPSTNAANAVEFDHDEFRLYFLGEGIARQIRPMSNRAKAEVLATFRRGPIPSDAVLALFRALTRDGSLRRADVIRFLFEVAGMDAKASYTHENIAALVIWLLSGIDGSGITIRGLSFDNDALLGKKLVGTIFESCYFSSSSLDLSELTNCKFIDCKFMQLRLSDTTRLSGVVFQACVVDALVPILPHREIWEPSEIRQRLEQAGVHYLDATPPAILNLPAQAPDPELVDVEKVLRYFMRSTHMSESVIRIKLGARGPAFIDGPLSQLLMKGVFVEIKNLGGGAQRRFRLGVPLSDLNDAMKKAKGEFDLFLSQF